MPIELYQNRLSGPSRAVLMTIKQLGLDVTIKNVDLAEDEQLKPEFIKVIFSVLLRLKKLKITSSHSILI